MTWKTASVKYLLALRLKIDTITTYASFVLNMIKIRTRKIVSVDFLASKLVAELDTSHIFATWNLSKLDKVR